MSEPRGTISEILACRPQMEGRAAEVNRPGFGHIAFAVDDVERACKAEVAARGGSVGPSVSLPLGGLGTVMLVYATDPEGNIIELQHWSK